MSTTKAKYTPRGYQEYILDRIEELGNENVLVELDCGLGKRFLTHQLVVETFPEKRFIIVVHSTSSLAETVDYMESEYGGLSENLGELSSRVRSGMREYILREKRVIVSTPQVLANVSKKHPTLLDDIDVAIINEVDTLVRRTRGRTALVFPWPTLLTFLREKRIIGMSGTLRDEHAVFTEEQLEIRKELKTLLKHIPDANLLTMEDLYGTDMDDYIEETVISVVPVYNKRIQSISIVIDELIRNTRIEIINQLQESDNLHLVQGDSRRIHLMLERLPISDDLKGRYSGLLLLRKYVYAMPPKQFIRMFHNEYLKHYFNVSEIRKVLPHISPKAAKIVELAKQYDKVVVLSSYLRMVSQVQDLLSKAGMTVRKITGKTRDKVSVLNSFKKEAVDALVMSPVGERDLDLPEADAMIVADIINTSKTMYQKFKRTRGGQVIILVYEGTSEERKVEGLVNRVLDRYPWSTRTDEFS
ncbi:MAG: helicase-related protein [Candidatus Thorarchaeota archaeon]